MHFLCICSLFAIDNLYQYDENGFLHMPIVLFLLSDTFVNVATHLPYVIGMVRLISTTTGVLFTLNFLLNNADHKKVFKKNPLLFWENVEIPTCIG